MHVTAFYTIGVDFGTESGRAVLVDISNGREIANSVYKYQDGVISDTLPGGGPKLPPDFALQNPSDYLHVFEKTIPAVLAASGVDASRVIGIGVDFTACTILPTDKNGQPLCWNPRFRNNPHAWVKLWKHHAAKAEAQTLNDVAVSRGESFLRRYGGKISLEWFFPKAWEILNAAPEVYAAADRIIEAADWVVWQLSGVECRNACCAGYKGLWAKDTGFPQPDFFAALDPRLKNIVSEKMSTNIVPAGTRVGGLTPAWAAKLGLPAGIAIAAANIDAHMAVPATTVVEPGKMVMVMGTSTCHMLLSDEQKTVPGMCGVVRDGIVPGYFGYESGQAAVGDIFAWYVENGVPARYLNEANQKGISVYELLEEKAANLKPGQSGLLALDWWNGNRSILGNADLSGLIIGYTLQTKPEEIYRALIEATAFGTYTIIKSHTDSGLPVHELYACGGLAERSSLLMQIYADVTGRSIRVAASSQTPALGAAMFAAVAAGSVNGGYDSVTDAATRMAGLKGQVYQPDPARHAVYEQLYSIYMQLHDHFGRNTTAMQDLRRLRNDTLAASGGL